MKQHTARFAILLALTVAASGGAWAKKPPSKSEHASQHGAQQHKSHGAESRDEDESHGKHHEEHDKHGYFDDERTRRIRDYYARERKSGKCPPGLAKKNNGCRAPGQVKQWQRGESLPRDVEYYDLPSVLLRELGRTPEGQKIVRVGTDLLLIDAASRTVIEAIKDLDDIF